MNTVCTPSGRPKNGIYGERTIVKKEEALFEGKRTFILKKHVQVNQFAKMGRLGLS